MYEEEDDDVNPNTVYRQMTNMGMHGMIDRRFNAYYQHQIQMQQAINEMNMKSNGHSFNGIAPFQPHQSQAQLQQQRRMMPQGYGAHLQYPFGMQGANMYPAPQNYRQMPYSLPGGHSHGRSLSMHIPNQNPMVQQQVNGARLSQANSPVSPQTQMLQQGLHKRHLSMPIAHPNSAVSAPSPSSLGMPTFTRSPVASAAQHAGSPVSDSSDHHNQQGQQAYYNNNWPFTTELPGESQRFIEGMQQPMINFSSPQYPVQNLIANNGKPGIQLHTQISTPIANMNINPLQGTPILVNKVNDVLPPSVSAISPQMSASRTNTPPTEAIPTPNNDMPPLQAPKPEDSSNLDTFLQTNYDYGFDGSDTYDFSLGNSADMFGESQFDSSWDQYLNPSDWSAINDHKVELHAADAD